MVKRLVDIVLSAALLFLALPILALAAILIRLTSPGPALFRQARMGRSFQPFEILKLRTMAHQQPGLAYTLGRDPRITPIGQFLRDTKVDELPQLWNVLRGDMSLVGPRPVVPELAREFRESYTALLRARPGLTDPASLKYRHETRLLTRVTNRHHFFKTIVTPDKIRISIDYMNRANLWTDSATMAMTVAVCCFPFLSRLYGPLPIAQETADQRPSRLRPQTMLGRPATDGSIFNPDLAYLEAAAEQASRAGILQPIPLPEPVFSAQSPSATLN